jgi:hypothetical protein
MCCLSNFVRYNRAAGVMVGRRTPADRRPLHDDEARALQALHKPLGDDPRHDLGGVMLPPAAIKAQRVAEGVERPLKG